MSRLKVLRIFLIVLVLAAMVVSIVACTPRTDNPPDITPGDPTDVTVGTPITKTEANRLIGEGLTNRAQKYAVTGNEEWFVLDFSLNFLYNDYTTGATNTSAIKLDFKANFHLTDNMRSQLLLEFRDNVTSSLLLGVYYYEQVLYVSVLPGTPGYPAMNYYMPELNLTKIGQTLSGLMDKLGGLDPAALIMGIVGAQSQIDALLESMGVVINPDENGKSQLSIDGLVNSIAQGILFDLESGSTVEYSAGNTRRATRVPVLANSLLGLLRDASSLGPLIGIPDFQIGWTLFGFPDFDPLLEQFLGFSIRSIRDKNWPPMLMTIGSIDNLQTIRRTDGTTYEGFVTEGMEIKVEAKTDEAHPMKEFDVNIEITPFVMAKSSNPAAISFAGKNLSTSGTKYTEGGLLNFETSLSIEVEAKAGTVLTLDDVIGELIDLGSVGSMPIEFGSNTAEGDRTYYEFNVELKVDLDMFDGDKNRMELNLNYDAGFGELRPIISVYLIGDTIYVETTAIGGENYALPNLAVSGLDLTGMLFGSGGLLQGIMPFLDPNADTTVVPSDPEEGGSEGEGSELENDGTGFNLNTLLGILANFYEYEDPETGEMLPPTWILPDLTEDPANTPMSIKITGAGLSTILSMFMDDAIIGIRDIIISVPLSGTAIDDNENSLFKLEVNVSDDLSLKIKLNSLAYMERPEFRYDSHEEINAAAEEAGRGYSNLFGDNTYHIEMGGYIDFGIDKSVNNSAAEVDLGAVLSGVLSNLMINIGVTDFARTSIGYKVLANLDMKNTVGADFLNYISFGGSSLAVHFYLPTATVDEWQNQRFLSIYYDGTSDYLYIDFTNLGNLQQKVSVFKFVNGQLPNISVKLGLEGKLDFRNTLTMFLPKNQAAAAAVLGEFGLYGYAMTGSAYELKELDILDVVGKLLTDITVSENALSILASAQLLNVLMQVLGVNLSLPEVNLSIDLDVINGDTDVLELHFGIIDKASSEKKEFVSLNVVPLTHAQITAGEGRVFDVTTNDFVNIEELMKSLSVTFQLSGNLYLDGNPNYEGFDLDDLLGEMLGGALGGTLSQILKVYVETKELNAHIDFTLRLNLNLSEMSIEGGKISLPNIGNSELHLNVSSRENGDVLNVYLKGGTLYVELEAFGMANLAIDGVGDMLFGLVNGSTEASAVMANTAPDTSNKNYTIGNLAQASNTVALGIQVWISPYSIALALAGDQLSNLLSELLGLKKSSVTVQDTEIKLDFEDGVALSVTTGIETINLNIGLSGLGIWFGDENSGNNYVISVPNLSDPSYWHRGNLSSITESVHVQLEAEVSFSSTPNDGDRNRLDLSPVVGGILPGVSLEAFIDIFGADAAGIVLSVDAYLNLNNILASTFRVEMRDGEGNAFLTAIYKGYVGSNGSASGDLYVKTTLFGLSPDKFTLIPNVMSLFGGSGSALSETANTARILSDTAEEDRSALSRAAGYTAFADYIKITFAGGRLAVIVTEDVLVSILSAFGIDLSPFFDETTAEIKIEVSATPLHIGLSATVSGINLSLGLGGLSVDFAKPDLAADNLTDVEEIRDFGAIGVDVTAELSIESLAGADGKVYFDNLVKNLLGSLNVELPLDKDVLSELGVLVELIGKNGGKFQGALYIRIQVILNLTDINNLYVSLKIGTVLENDKLEVGDVLDVQVFGGTRTTVDAAGTVVSSLTADVYVDAENLTGIKPFKVEDVVGLLGAFTSTAMATDVAVMNESGKVTVYEKPLAKLAALANSDNGDQQLAAQILIRIAVEYEDYGMSSPIVASVTSGAIYSVLLGLAGIDISAFLDGHDPEVNIGLLGGNTLLSLNAGLKDALKVDAVLNLPNISLSPVYPDTPKYDRVLSADNVSASVEVEGTLELNGKTDGSDNDRIKIDTILNGILGGTQFGVLINLLTDISPTLHYRLAATVNVKDLLTGDWNGINALLELRGGSGRLLVGVYYFDETGDGQNDLLLDLSALNMGRMRIDGFARFMTSLFDTFAPPSASEAFIEAQNNAPLNANGERADNTGLLQAYINLSLGMDRVLALHVGADVVALLVTALNITDDDGNPLISGEEIINTVNGILALDIWAFDMANGSLLGLQLSVASYTLGLSIDRVGIQIDPEDMSVVGEDFDASLFGYVGEMTQDFYMKAEMTFGWDMKEGMQVSFGEILSSVLSINNLAVEPVLSILKDISQEFTLSVEAKIHFGNLLANGALLNDLMFDIANGRYDGVDVSAMFVNGNMALMTDSEGNRLLILRGGDEENGYTYKAVRLDVLLQSSLAVVLSDDKGDEVLSLRFSRGNLYVNLAVLGIGKFMIEDAVPTFLDLFTPMFGLSTVGYALDAAPSYASDAQFASYVAKETSVISQFININVSPEAFAVQISSSALFAVLKTLGLDVNNIKLSDSLILDLENMVNSLGSLNISAELLGENKILALKLALNEWMTDGDGNRLENPDKYLSLTLGINNNITLSLVPSDMPEMLPPADSNTYDVFTDAQMSFATRLELKYGLNAYENSNINKEPLSGLLGNYLSDLIVQLGVNVVGNYGGTVAVDIRANIRLLDLINEITSGQLTLGSIQAEIKMSFNDEVFLTVQLVYGDIYVDLSALNGPKLKLKDFASLFAPAESTVDLQSDAAKEQRAVAAAFASGRVSESNVMPISIELLGSGLYVVLRNAAFNALFAMLGLQPFEMFEQLTVQLFADENGVGLGIAIQDNSTDFLSLSLAINELSIRMNPIPQRPTEGDGREPMVPPTAEEQREYKNLMDINTVLGSASFEVSIDTKDGAFEFATLLNSLWDASALLGKGLAPKLTLEDLFGDTIRLDLDIVFNTSFYETVTGAHYYQSEGRLVIGGNTYTVVGSDIRDIANRKVGTMNSNGRTFSLDGTNYSYTEEGVVKASKGVQRILEGIQVKAHVYSVNHQDYFDIYIYFVGGVAYIDAECLGISKVKIPVNSVMDLVAMFTGGNTTTDVNAATAVYSSTAPAYYDAMDRLFAAPVSAYNAAGKTVGIVDILVNRDGLFATVGSGMLFGVLRMVGLSDQMVTAIENTAKPQIRLSVDNRFTLSLGVDLTAVGDDPASISLGASIITRNIKVDTEVDSTNPELSIIEPLISAEEKESYVSFDELEIYTELNISLSLELLRGNINLDAILDLVIATMKANLNIGETHRIDVNIGAKLGISLKNFLSMDLETAKNSVYGELSVAFAISDDSFNFEQEVINIAIRNDGIFATVNLFDSTLKVRIPDFTVGELLYGMLGFGDKTETASYGANTVKQDMPSLTANLPVSALYGYAAEGRAAVGGDALEILLSLNSREFSLEISLLTVTTVLSALGFGEIDLTALVSSIFDGGKLGVNYDRNFYIYLNIGKGATEDNGGYDLTVKLLNDTVIDLSGEGFESLKSGLDDRDFEGYVAFDLMAVLNGEDFDILGFVGKISASVDLTVSAELKEYLIDWSKIFENNSIDSLLYIQINEALSGAVTLTLQFDVDLVELLKGRLALDVALSFKNTQGFAMLSLAVRGLGRYGDSPENDLVIMMHVPGTPMPDFVISGADINTFMGLDYNVIINNILSGLGLTGEEAGQAVSLASRRAGAPSPAGIVGDDNGLEILPGVNIANLLDSLSLTKGKVAVVITKNIIAQVLLALFGFPFEDIQGISVSIDFINNEIAVNVNLAAVGDTDETALGFGLAIGGLDIALGGRNMHEGNCFLGDTDLPLGLFSNLADLKTEIELRSELLIDDRLISFFDLSDFTNSLLGMDVVLRSGEQLHIAVELIVKIFIDFSDIGNVGLSLGVVYDGKQYVGITFKGDGNNGSNSTAYVDLSGLGLPAVSVSGIDIETLVRDMMANLMSGGESAEAATVAMPAMAEVLRSYSADGNTDKLFSAPRSVQIPAEDLQFGTALLMLTISSKEFALSITGALAASLVHGINESIALPQFNRLTIGYVEEEDGTLRGLRVTLDDEEMFLIQFGFTGGSFRMGEYVESTITAEEDFAGNIVDNISNIDILRNVYLSLHAEVRLKTTNDDETGKSRQIEDMEKLVETLVGMPEGSFDLSLQSSSMVFTFDLEALVNLADFNKTQLYLEIGYGDMLLIGVYYTLPSPDALVPQVYVDLSGLGLFKAAVTGIDLVGIIGNLLGSFVTEEGLNIGDMIAGLLGGGQSEQSAATPVRAANSGPVAMLGNAANTQSDSAKGNPTLTVIVTNSEIVVSPNIAVLEKLTGIDLPDFLDLRVSINLKEGLNNLSLSLKIDQYSNSVQISVPVGDGLRLELNHVGDIHMPANFEQYGGVNGVSLSMGASGLNVSIGTRGLINSLVDSIFTDDLSIVLEKRNSYWARTKVSKWFDNNPYVGSYGPYTVPENTATAVGQGDYLDYRHINNSNLTVYNSIKRSVLSVSRTKTNILEIDGNLNNNGLHVIVAYNAGRINLKIPSLIIRISVQDVLNAVDKVVNTQWIQWIAPLFKNVMIPINVGAILNAFVPNGINVYTLILNDLIAENRKPDSSIGAIYGTVFDEEGNALSGVQVSVAVEGMMSDVEKVVTTETDGYGNYALVGLEEGIYEMLFSMPGKSSISVGNVDVKGLAHSAATHKDVYMLGDAAAAPFTNITVSGRVTDSDGGAVSGAQLYLDGTLLMGTLSDSQGNYSFTLNEIRGQNHAVGVTATGYVTPEELSFTVTSDNAMVTGLVFRMEAESDDATKTLIQGVLKDSDGTPVQHTAVQLWLAKDGKTHLMDEIDEDGNETRNLDPVNFFNEEMFEVRSDASGRFWVEIPNEYLGTDNANLKFKVRSETYNYVNKEVSDITLSVAYYLGEITLTKRAEHWSAKTLDKPIAGVRIRLGADKLDKKVDTEAGGMFTTVSYDLVNGVMGGEESTNDSVSYVELWINSDIVANLLGSLMFLLAGKTAGFTEIATDARLSTQDLVPTGDKNILKQIEEGNRYYNENDETVFDFRWNSRTEYAIAAHSMVTRLPAAFLATLLGPIIKNAVSGFVAKLIELAAEQALGGALSQLGDNIAALLQFPLPYNVLGGKDLKGNLLSQTWSYDPSFVASDELDKTAIDADGDGTAELTRSYEFMDRAVYVKLTLNARADGLIESASVFINGIRYEGEAPTIQVDLPYVGSVGSVGGNITSDSNTAFNAKELDKSAGDGVERVQVMSNGTVIADKQKYVNEWVAKNAIQSYFIVDDKNAEGETVNRYYYLVHESKAKDGAYMEIDLVNSGLSLRAGSTALGGSEDNKYFNWHGSNVRYTPPSEIIFNDPYDPTDFTFIGGSWANAGSGVRTNADTTKTVYDFLPERYEMSFTDGTSTGSNGVAVFWSYDSVNFDPKGGTYSLVGACLNQIIEIPVTVRPRVVDPAASDILSNLPVIDPMNFDEEAYLESLPSSFADPNGTYVFNNLQWNMSDTVINYAGGDTTVRLTYSMTGTAEDSDYKSAKATIEVPVHVLNRTVTSVDTALNGSINGINASEVWFDPFVETDPVSRLRALDELVVTTVEGAAMTVAVSGYDTSSMWNYRTGETASEQRFTVYYEISDSLGNRQRVPVTVVISSKEIVGTTVSDLSLAARTIIPYVDSGIYSKDIGLNLPTTVTVRYEDGTTAMFAENVDYVWGAYREGSPSAVYFKDNFDDLFTAFEAATYVIGLYSVNANGNLDRNNEFEGEYYFTELYVSEMELYAVPMLTVSPSTYYELPTSYAVYFNDGRDCETVSVEWSITAADLLANFSGGTYSSLVTVRGALFETQSMPGVRVDVGQIIIKSVDFGRYDPINPFNLANEVEELFGRESITLKLLGGNDDGVSVVGREFFDIVGFETISGADLDNPRLTSARFKITVANKGYNPDNPATVVWEQTFAQSLDIMNVSNSYIYFDYVDRANPNLSGETRLPYTNTVAVSNALDGVMPTEIWFAEGGEKYQVVYEVDGLPDDAYTRDEITVRISPKAWPEAKKTLTVRIYNKFEPMTEDAVSFPNMPEEVRSLASLFLPEYAEVNLKYYDDGIADNKVNDGGTVTGRLPVFWRLKDGGDLVAEAGKMTELKLVGRVGQMPFGFFEVEKTVVLTPSEITDSGISGTLEINPLTGHKQTAVEARVDGEVAVLSIIYPEDIEITYEGNEYRNHYVYLAQITELSGSSITVRAEVPADVTVLSRRVVAVKNRPEGTVYSQIDFSALERTTVVFDNGEEMITDLVWSGTEDIGYTVQGGVSYVYATVFAGQEGLEHTFRVPVRIRQAVLEAVYYPDGSEITRMSVDPYVGFTELPERVLAKFYGSDTLYEINAEWTVAHIVRNMTVEGGEFTAENQNAAELMIYLLSADGSRYAQQTVTVDVTVEDRSIVTEGSEIKVEFTRKDGSKVDLNAGREEAGTTAPVYDGETNTVTFSMTVNPYNPATGRKYSEDRSSDAFYYFDGVTFTLGGGVKMSFDADGIDYRIYDNDTKLATVTHNLYTGRNVVVEMRMNTNAVYDADGNQVLARNAEITVIINVRILNMSYVHGGGFSTEYTVDMYGEWFGNSLRESYDAYIGYVDLIKNVLKDNVGQTVYVEEGNEYSFVPGLISFETANANPNFVGGTGTVYAKLGSETEIEMGGEQRIAIKLNYLRRVLTGVFDASSVREGGYSTNVPNYYANLSLTDNRTALNINEASVNKITNGGAYGDEAFLIDPFSTYDKETFFPSNTVKVIFDDGSSDGLVYDASSAPVDIFWDTGRMFVDYYGGVFSVKASVGENEATQSVSYRLYVLSRKVRSNHTENPFGGLVKSSFNGIHPYKYMYSGNVEQALSADIFNTGAFEIKFEEGAPIRYNLGATASSGQIVGNSPLFTNLTSHLGADEADTVMNFTLDAGQGLNSDGRDVRFYITIPGFGMGITSKQTVSLYVKSIPEKIYDARALENGSAVTFATYWQEAISAGAMTTVGGSQYAFHISNPYYFIMQGGIKMPDRVRIYVNETGTAAGGTGEYYDINTWWNNSNGNVVRVNYYDQEVGLSFNVDLDNQLFNKLTVSVTPRILASDVIFSQTGTSDHFYGEDEVILLPTSPIVSGFTVNGVKDGFATDDYSYSVSFGNDLTVTFNDINGGGTNRNDINKWDFSSVKWNFPIGEWTAQTATLTLGGRGGQQIKWRFKTVDKTWVNSSISTVQVFAEGTALDFSAIGGSGSQLPTTVKQYFDVNYLYNGTEGYTSIAVPVTYGELLNSQMQTSEYFSDTSRPQFTFDRATGTLSPTSTSATPVRQWQSDSNIGAAAIRWSATTKRAYPSPKKDIGGYVYVAYASRNGGSTTQNTYIVNPTREAFSYESMAPSLVDWRYRAGMSALNGSDDEGNKSYSGLDFYSDASQGNRITEAPIISVNANAMFDTVNLPLYEVQVGNEKYVNFVDWNHADVWYSTRTTANDASFHVNRDADGNCVFEGAVKLNKGIFDINTSSRLAQGGGTGYGTYYVVAKVPGVTGRAGEVVIAIETVG